MKKNKHIFDEVVKIFSTLRGPRGCPWDKVQTVKSLKKDLVSEVREVVRAIDKNDIENLKEELGDVIWDVLLICQVAEEKKYFNAYDVLNILKKKVVRRHPHVFGKIKAKNAKDALRIFNSVKKNERKNVYM